MMRNHRKDFNRSQESIQPLIARNGIQKPGFNRQFHTATGEVFRVDFTAGEGAEVNTILSCQGIHEAHKDISPIQLSPRSAVECGVVFQVCAVVWGGIQSLEIGGYGREPGIALCAFGNGVPAAQEPVQAGMVVVDQAITLAGIGFEDVFEDYLHGGLLVDCGCVI